MGNSSLEYGWYYHIYNRGNNSEILFKEMENYMYFLSLYKKYIDPIADTLAYCLMSNHFHLVIRVKEKQEIQTFQDLHLFDEKWKGIKNERKPTPSIQFAHLFNTYAKAINNRYKRTGTLFEHPFERRAIENEYYLKHCIAYAHENPVKARLVKSMSEYTWSSFNALISDKPTHVNRELVMAIFGDKEYFMYYHNEIHSLPEFEELF